MKNKLVLDREEKEIVDDYEDGLFQSIDDFEQEKRKLKQAAENTLKKDKRINIRISSRDLELIKKRAIREGIPYQTFISSILHKVVTGSYR